MTNLPSLLIDVQIACDDPDVPDSGEIETWIARAVAGSGKAVANDTELSVRLVDTEEIRALNRDYRHKDSATNVLSFPAGMIEGLPADAARVLGDIVVCATIVNEEAAQQMKAVADHWAHMLIHGTLHLLGYDHETDGEALEMERLETRILTENGLADPYSGSGNDLLD